MHRWFSLAVVGSMLLGCSSAGPEQQAGQNARCTPGEQNPCPCAYGGFGVHVCSDDGSAYGLCLGCPSGAAPGAGGGPPATGGASGVGGAPPPPPAAGGAAGAGGVGGVGGAPPPPPGTGGNAGVGGAPPPPPPATGGTGGAVGAGGSGSVGGFGGVGGGMPPPPPPDGSFAAELRIQEVAFFQGTKVSVARDGAAVADRNAPIVEGRPALVRVYVEPQAGWQPREVTARLDLVSSDPAVQPQGSANKTITSASSNGDMFSTFNFSIPGDQVTSDLQFQVSVREIPANETGAFGVVHPDAVFPPDQSVSDVGAQFSGPVRVTIVPFRYHADGSGRLPDTSQAQMQVYFDALWANYPTNEVQLELRETVDYFDYVGPSSGWSSWLDTLCNIRTNDNVDIRTYYYGVIAPADGWRSYGGGVAGLGNVPSANWTQGRCSVGLGFPGADNRGELMIHEVGHTFGRPHAPCGTDGAAFPHAGAKIGVWGYDMVHDRLKDPNDYRDFMSYCDPQWISDHSFSRIFDRVQFVNQNFSIQKIPPVTYRKMLIDVDGSVAWGHTVTLDVYPYGQGSKEVTLYDHNGTAVGSIEGHWFEYGEDPAGEILIAEPASAVTYVQAQGFPRLELK